jgi:hypothetical protein
LLIENAIVDIINSPCEPIEWKRCKRNDSVITNQSFFDENWDFYPIEVPTSFKYNKTIVTIDNSEKGSIGTTKT